MPYQDLSTHLNRSRCAAKIGVTGSIFLFAFTWIGFFAWVLADNSDRLGPVRFLIVLALVFFTTGAAAAGGCVWWAAVTWRKWLHYTAESVVAVISQAVTAGAAAGPDGAPGQRLAAVPHRR